MKKITFQAAIMTLSLAGCSFWTQTDPTDTNLGQACGGIAGITCPTGYTCEYDEPIVADGAGTCLLDLLDSATDTCPTDGPFEVTFDSADRYCECPKGYTKDSNTIGYATCYDNAECPILEVECIRD